MEGEGDVGEMQQKLINSRSSISHHQPLHPHPPFSLSLSCCPYLSLAVSHFFIPIFLLYLLLPLSSDLLFSFSNSFSLSLSLFPAFSLSLSLPLALSLSLLPCQFFFICQSFSSPLLYLSVRSSVFLILFLFSLFLISFSIVLFCLFLLHD